MNTKKTLTTSFVLALTVLIALGGIWQPASARGDTDRLEEGQTIGLGGQGMYVTNIPLGVSQVYLDNVGRDLPAKYSRKIDMHFRAPAMEVRFLDAKGGAVPRISAIVYVYFSIGRAERDLWFKSGMQEIAIWFANEQTGRWELCPTYFVHQSGSDGSVGRLSCLAPGSGYFVLSQGDFGKYVLQPRPAASSGAFISSYSPYSPFLRGN